MAYVQGTGVWGLTTVSPTDTVHHVATARKGVGQGNIFRSMCQEFCPRGGTPGRYTPRAGTPPWPMSGQYASYWNAFLLTIVLVSFCSDLSFAWYEHSIIFTKTE